MANQLPKGVEEPRPVVGIFVGGRSTRMGGAAKGLIEVNGETIVARLARVFSEALGTPRMVVVGTDERYADVGLDFIADDPPGVGPMGGLCGLLGAASASSVYAVACDMPHVPSHLVRKLADCAVHAAAVAPRMDRRWQPLFARYDAPRVLPVARRLLALNRRALHGVFEVLGEDATELVVTPAEARLLSDWDTPSDIG